MIFKISLFLTLVLALFPLDAVTVTASSIPSDSDPGLAGSYSGLATVTVGNTVSDQQGGGYCPVASNGNGAYAYLSQGLLFPNGLTATCKILLISIAIVNDDGTTYPLGSIPVAGNCTDGCQGANIQVTQSVIPAQYNPLPGVSLPVLWNAL